MSKKLEPGSSQDETAPQDESPQGPPQKQNDEGDQFSTKKEKPKVKAGRKKDKKPAEEETSRSQD